MSDALEAALAEITAVQIANWPEEVGRRSSTRPVERRWSTICATGR